MKNKTLHPHELSITLRQQSFLVWQQTQIRLILWRQQFGNWVHRYWFRLIIFGFATFIAFQKDISIQLSWQSPNPEQQTPHIPPHLTSALGIGMAKTISNQKNSVYTEKQKTQLAYVQRFSKVAQREMEKYGIPASIILAQGLLETNAGKSPLATENNNHFGVKCFSKKCKKGHCSNFSDDTHKDFFIKYPTAWESFRAHSELLQKERYRSLAHLKSSDYKAWAKGLKQAGYATDPEYAQKLIDLIEDLELFVWDKV